MALSVAVTEPIEEPALRWASPYPSLASERGRNEKLTPFVAHEGFLPEVTAGHLESQKKKKSVRSPLSCFALLQVLPAGRGLFLEGSSAGREDPEMSIGRSERSSTPGVLASSGSHGLSLLASQILLEISSLLGG